ncbi:hypothetical protein, partial [Streptomyces sp. Ncost-T10-10d]|uniref:hypothetical protein n=1 Tax=Streptomyces sp. Ncost-T10-10d TaxID=1839774 RepID=UPI00081E06AF
RLLVRVGFQCSGCIRLMQHVPLAETQDTLQFIRAAHMQSLLALIGAILGGSLVLLGDFVRRRVEKRKEAVARLVTVSAQLSSMYNRLCGQILDAADTGAAVADLAPADPLRYEVATQFFMAPGSEQLSSHASRLIGAYGRLRDAYGQESTWSAARDEHGVAVREFEAAVRAIVHRGHI